MRTLRCVLLLALSMTPLTAQITRIPNSGCPNAPFPRPSSEIARPGLRLTVVGATACAHPFPSIFLLGAASRATISRPVSCSDNCVLAVAPLLINFSTSLLGVTLAIPNDRRLVGVRFTVQTGCTTRERCITLHGALAVRIQA